MSLDSDIAANDDAAYFENVYKAFRDDYLQYHLSANHARRMNYLTLPREQKALLQDIGFKEKLDAVDEGIRRNAEFLEIVADSSQSPFLHGSPSHSPTAPSSPVITDDPHFLNSHTHSHDHGHEHSHDHGHDHDHSSRKSGGAKGGKLTPKQQTEKDQTQDKVRSTLRQMVRDWSIQGKPERDACYQPCLDALEAEFKDVSLSQRSSVKVLIPGAGLGRVALEIAARGFASQGNEFSAHMLIASNWCLNQSSAEHPLTIHPYLHSFSNHSTTHNSLLISVSVPDITPAALLPPGADFSFVAGDFLEVYGGLRPDGSWGQAEWLAQGAGGWAAVVTIFFVDTARNIVNYLKVIWEILEPGGVWINNGPLLWHFENSSTDQQGQGSIELSLDELKALARKIGFEITHEQTFRTTYAGFEGSMLRSEYQSAFFIARKPALSRNS